MAPPTIDFSRAISARCRRVATNALLYESDSRVVLQLLARRLLLKPASGAYCTCPGTLVLEVVGAVPSVITLHHGTSVRWPGSPGNVDLDDPDAMMEFLAEKGMGFVRDEHQATLGRAATDKARAEPWRAVTPRSLQRFNAAIADFRDQKSLREWSAALAQEFPSASRSAQFETATGLCATSFLRRRTRWSSGKFRKRDCAIVAAPVRA